MAAIQAQPVKCPACFGQGGWLSRMLHAWRHCPFCRWGRVSAARAVVLRELYPRGVRI